MMVMIFEKKSSPSVRGPSAINAIDAAGKATSLAAWRCVYGRSFSSSSTSNSRPNSNFPTPGKTEVRLGDG